MAGKAGRGNVGSGEARLVKAGLAGLGVVGRG